MKLKPWNGDAGVVVHTPDGPRAAFLRGAGTALVPLSRLYAVSPAHALTVHGSQTLDHHDSGELDAEVNATEAYAKPGVRGGT